MANRVQTFREVLSPVLASIYINDVDKDKKRKGISVDYMIDLKYRGKMENILGNRMRTQNTRENTTGINVRFCTGAKSPGMSTGWGWLAGIKAVGLVDGKYTMNQKHDEAAWKAVGLLSSIYRNEAFRILYYTERQRWQLFKDLTQCPSLSQPSQDVVKEMIQFSKDTLEKIDKARSEGLYHEVRIHFYRRWGWKGPLARVGKGGVVKMEKLPSRLFFWKTSLGWDQDSSCP